MSKPLWADQRVESPCPGHPMSTPWGKKPNDDTYWQARGHHTGRDYACPTGTPVVAVLDGVIAYRTDTVLGLVVLLFAVNGNTYWYCHLSKRSAPVGRVTAGQVLGYAGMTGTGAAMGPHLHFEERHGHTSSWAGEDFDPMW
jgi:murein DD-endopeptidase MepM/ murein hydrolase activator NlpD